MPTQRFSESLAVEVPTGYRTVVAPEVTENGTRQRGGRLPSGRMPLDSTGPSDGPATRTPGLLAALSEQGFELVDGPVLLEPDPQVFRRRAGRARLNVDVDIDQDAVILVEQDGMFSWRPPDKRTHVELPASQRRSPFEARAARRRIAFEVPLVASERAESQRRGWVKDLAFSRVRVFVLKYLARKIVGSVVRHLEAHVQTGLREITGTDPLKWVPFSGSVNLPKGRPPRVLLFVHGTFSSTIGAFGVLGATPHGRKVLSLARGRYDLLMGYDHLTLSVNPSENGAELLSMLRAIDWPEPPVFDIVCHSRGALVTRSLIEEGLPQSGWKASVDRVVFVAGVNAGTYLAAPKNWARFVDLYTNLAAAAARLLPERVAATILGEVIKGVGALVKLTASYAATEQGAPGLAAMEPDGEFVKRINETQPGQPLPTTTAWFVIGGEFEPNLSLANVKTLPKRFVMALADAGIDQLMRQPNDLVVHVASMAAIDSPVGQASQFVQDEFTFGPQEGVFHTIYFARPETSQHLTKWLNLTPVPARVRRRTTRSDRSYTGERQGFVIDRIAAAPFDFDLDLEMYATRALSRPDSSTRGGRKVDTSIGRSQVTRAAPGEKRTSGSRRSADSRASKSKRVRLPTLPAPVPGSQRRKVTATVSAHFRASMPPRAQVGKRVTVQATISREALAAVGGLSENEF